MGVAAAVLTASLVVLLSTARADTDPGEHADPADQRVRTLLAEIESTPELIETFHTDPRVLASIGIFLQARDADGLTAEQMTERFERLVPVPPWEWRPVIAFRRIRPGLYLVGLSQAWNGTPSSLYLYDGPRPTKIDSAESGTSSIENVYVDRDRIEIVYFPNASGTGPTLASALLEKRGTGWRVDHDTPYRRVSSLLGECSTSEMQDPNVHRNTRLLNAFALFLQHAGRLGDAELGQHMSALFPPTWHNAHPTFDIRRVGPGRYLVLIASNVPNVWNGTLYLFDRASYVTLVSEDAAGIAIEDVVVSGNDVGVTYQSIGGDHGPVRRESLRAEQDGRTWRVSREPPLRDASTKAP